MISPDLAHAAMLDVTGVRSDGSATGVGSDGSATGVGSDGSATAVPRPRGNAHVDRIDGRPEHLVVTVAGEGLALYRVANHGRGLTTSRLQRGSTSDVVASARRMRPELLTVVAPADRQQDLGTRFAEACGPMSVRLREGRDTLRDLVVAAAEPHP